MEYLYYLLVIGSLIALCLYLFRPASSWPRKPQPAEARPGLAQAKQDAAVQRGLRNVPIPWGWPGSPVRSEGMAPDGRRGASADGGASVQSWVDRLIAEKRTVEDSEYLSRKNDSLRALLEDRYGRSVRPAEVAYQQVRPPRLRDPNRPHDQMDNFPSGKTAQIVSRLQAEPKRDGGSRPAAAARRARAALKEVRTPWGW